MAVTIELPRERWKDELGAFSKRNTGRPVRVEVWNSSGEGEPLLAEHQPLLGIDFDRKGSAAPAVEITVGTLYGKTPTNDTHAIHDPARIWIEEEPDGLGIALQIESRDEGATKVLFEPQEALPGERAASRTA